MPPKKSTLTFETESLPTFFVGVPVNFTIQASGGNTLFGLCKAVSLLLN
jgi:hypothetical protein